GAILRLALQDEQGRLQAEAQFVFFCAADDQRLKRREVVRQPGEARRQQTRVLHLGGEELHSVGQSRGGEHLLADVLQHFLRGQTLRGQTLAQHAEEIRLFDVFFSIKNLGGGHAAIINPKSEIRK